MRGIYFGKFELVGRIMDFDAGHLPELRKELALLAMIDPVVIPPDHLVHNPLALPALQSLKTLVRSGRIGTSGNPGGLTQTGLLEKRVDEALEGVSRQNIFLIKKAKSMKNLIRDMFPLEFTLIRDVSRQILQYSQAMSHGLIEAAEKFHLPEARLLLDYAARSFDLDQGLRDYWLMVLRRLRGAVDPVAYRTLLMMLQSAYFRFGAIANDSIWYPDKFWARLRHLPLPRSTLPATVESDFSFDNLMKITRLLGADLTPALGLNDKELYELIGTTELQKLFGKIKKALLSPKAEDFPEIEPRPLVDVRTWLEKYDPSSDEVMAAANLAVRGENIFLPKTYAVRTSVIMQEEIGNFPPGAPDCTYSPRSRILRRGQREITLPNALADLFMILVIHSSLGIHRWYVAQDELENAVTNAVLASSRKLNRIEKSLLLLAARDPKEQDNYVKRIRKRQERLRTLIKPLGLSIGKNRFGIWTVTGGKVLVEGGAEIKKMAKPGSFMGPPRLRRVFEILASYYPNAVPSEDIVRFLEVKGNLPPKIDLERKVWRDVSALKHYLKKSSSRCAVKTESRGRYRLACGIS